MIDTLYEGKKYKLVLYIPREALILNYAKRKLLGLSGLGLYAGNIITVNVNNTPKKVLIEDVIGQVDWDYEKSQEKGEIYTLIVTPQQNPIPVLLIVETVGVLLLLSASYIVIKEVSEVTETVGSTTEKTISKTVPFIVYCAIAIALLWLIKTFYH